MKPLPNASGRLAYIWYVFVCIVFVIKSPLVLHHAHRQLEQLQDDRHRLCLGQFRMHQRVLAQTVDQGGALARTQDGGDQLPGEPLYVLILNIYSDRITTYLSAHPPASIDEAVDAIRVLTGLTRSPTQVRLFLKVKCG